MPEKSMLTRKEKVNITVEVSILELVQILNFSLNWSSTTFLNQNWSKKSISGRKQRKWTSPLNFTHSDYSRYQVSAQTNNFDFWDIICPKSLFQKRYFLSKREKVDITIEFCKFELKLGAKFQHKLTILIFFGPNLPQKVFPVWKRKKWALPLKPAYLD